MRGWAMQCRINAEDPWNDYLPSPGLMTRFRLPQGPCLRVDTYGYAGCEIPQRYDPLLANLMVGRRTVQSALHACGEPGGISRGRRADQHPVPYADLMTIAFIDGAYDTNFMTHFRFERIIAERRRRKDLAAIVAVAYALRGRVGKPETPQRIQTGWHRSARRLPV